MARKAFVKSIMPQSGRLSSSEALAKLQLGARDVIAMKR